MAIIALIAILIIASGTNSESVGAKDKLRADISNIKDQVNGMSGNTDDLVESLDAFSTGLDDYIKTEDAAGVFKSRVDKANTVVSGTLKAIPKFKSGDPGQIISGVLDMTSMALTTFGGPHGAAVAMVLNIVSSLIGLFMTTPKAAPSIDQVMRDALDEFQDDKLYKRMNSFASSFNKVHNGIIASRNLSKDTEGRDLSANDITNFKTEIKSFEADTLMEDVKQFIADELTSGKVSDAKRALKTFEMYCKLTTCMELILVEFMDYVKEEGQADSKLPTYYHGFLDAKRKEDKKYFEFLHHPEIEKALIAAIYQNSPEKYPILREYIAAIKVSPIPNSGLSEGKVIYLTPKKWPKWHLYLSSEKHSLIYGSESVNDQSRFILKKAISGDEGYEWMIENKKYPGHFITATKKEGCLPLTNPDEIDYVEGLTMTYINRVRRSCSRLCIAKCGGCYSNCYSTFKIGRLRNILSYNYVWRFTKLKSEGRCSHYLISATQEQFGPEYTLFMKNSANANGYLKYGNPKEQGMFALARNGCK